MAKSPVQQLTDLVNQLQQERQQHVEAIAKIDDTFRRFGIDVNGKAPAARSKAGAAKGSTTKRSKGAKAKNGKSGRRRQTADQFVLSKLANGRKLSTAEINAAWKKTARAGDAGNTLTSLVKDGKLTRENIKGARGSMYQKA